MSERPTGSDFLDVVNGLPDGWERANGLRFLSASGDEVTAELVVGRQHLQPYGLVHGGVYAGVIESLASVGAALDVLPQGKSAVGLENHTSFIRACRGGTLHATARPVTRGSRSQVWDVTITDEDGRVLATGRVRVLVLDTASPVAGGTLAVRQA
jgi:uncharacterized protein (TIGR00369 family)